MVFKNFSITAFSKITDAYYKYGNNLKEVSNGFLSQVMYCDNCQNIYELKLIKINNNKVSKEFLKNIKGKK